MKMSIGSFLIDRLVSPSGMPVFGKMTRQYDCEGLPYGQHEDELHLAPSAGKGAAVAKLKAFACSEMVLAIAPDQRTRMAARLVKPWARWRREAEAKRQAALLSSFSDHLLRDIGVARDQIDSYTHDEYYGE